MAQVRRRYTTVDGKVDWIVTLSYDESALNRAHWFEAKIAARNEATGASFAFPKEIAAMRHVSDTIFRRVYSYIERGH
jgi:hypothetical protein